MWTSSTINDDIMLLEDLRRKALSRWSSSCSSGFVNELTHIISLIIRRDRKQMKMIMMLKRWGWWRCVCWIQDFMIDLIIIQCNHNRASHLMKFSWFLCPRRRLSQFGLLQGILQKFYLPHHPDDHHLQKERHNIIIIWTKHQIQIELILLLWMWASAGIFSTLSWSSSWICIHEQKENDKKKNVEGVPWILSLPLPFFWLKMTMMILPVMIVPGDQGVTGVIVRQEDMMMIGRNTVSPHIIVILHQLTSSREVKWW